MREIVSPLDGFGSPFGTRSKPQIITALIRPALAPIVSGDTVEDALSADVDQPSNYASTAGTIATVQVDILVNGETPAALDIPLDAGDTIALSVTVTDSEANVRVFTASRVVGAVAPTNDVAPSIAGDTELGDVLTVTAGDWSGDPAPTLSYQWRRDGAAITGETGTTYTITLADSGADIDVVETATNSAGSASQASNAITADTFTAPDAFTAPDWGLANDDGDISVNILTLPADGGAPITDLEYRVNAGAAVSFGETTTGSYPIVADEDDEVQIRAVNAVGAGDWSDVKVVPAAVAGVQATGGTETVITQGGNFYRVHTFLTGGDFVVTQGGDVEYLVVAGGGGGGPRLSSGGGGGGGGAGGFRLLQKNIDIGSYAASVGLGGSGRGTNVANGDNGENSSIFDDVATGGGGGGARLGNGASGGSGGGAGNTGTGGVGNSPATTPAQGFNGGGGNSGVNGVGFGGGGASETTADRNGGDGVFVDWADLVGLGDTGYFAGGGGASSLGTGGLGGGGNGGELSAGTLLTSGLANTGGGGGGAAEGNSGSAAGGSGIVIIRYEISEAEYLAEV